MKYATVLVLVSAMFLAAPAKPVATYVGHAKVASAASGADLAKGPDFTVLMMKRTGAGHVEMHDKETDTFYILDGAATFITGGTMLGGRVIKLHQHQGSRIEGGKTYQLTKGDVIVIPAGTPHWFMQVPRSITYYVVKAVKP
jgi:mannose-6-phosphate isomerase-like protein (cupin superfamily)